MSEDSKKFEQPFEHLLRTLQEGEVRRLIQCLEEFDHRLLNCRKSLDEYRRLRTTLRSINNDLSRLGAKPLSVVEDELPTSDLSEILKKRIDLFKSTGKI
jgi:hypothetical protein